MPILFFRGRPMALIGSESRDRLAADPSPRLRLGIFNGRQPARESLGRQWSRLPLYPASCFPGRGAVSRFLYRPHYRRTKSESQGVSKLGSGPRNTGGAEWISRRKSIDSEMKVPEERNSYRAPLNRCCQRSTASGRLAALAICKASAAMSFCPEESRITPQRPPASNLKLK